MANLVTSSARTLSSSYTTEFNMVFEDQPTTALTVSPALPLTFHAPAAWLKGAMDTLPENPQARLSFRSQLRLSPAREVPTAFDRM